MSAKAQLDQTQIRANRVFDAKLEASDNVAKLMREIMELDLKSASQILHLNSLLSE